MVGVTLAALPWLLFTRPMREWDGSLCFWLTTT